MTEPVIHCQQLSHFYADKAALDQVSFEILAGEPVGLVGPNGAGKTTLLNILSGFLRPTSGSVTLLGHPPGTSQVCGKVSALPQDARLDPSFSIGEQLVFYARLQGFKAGQAKHEAQRVLAAVVLPDSFHEKPVALSHGMAKRVAIAQALIGKPQLILLDEPTAGLDPVNTRNIRSIIAELSAHTTFMISSHDLAELGRVCQQILLLDKGMMKPMQLNASDNNSDSRFFTIQMEPCTIADVMTALKRIEGVLQVSHPQKNELVVEYNPAVEAPMDLKIMTCLAEKNWLYRQISQGKTLEEQLFFDNRSDFSH